MAASDHLIAAAIVVAAGSGSRLGADVPKAFVAIAGRTMLEHALASLLVEPRITQLVLVAPAQLIDQARGLAPNATVVAGGAMRQESVSAGLAALGATVDLVLVHDVARAFVPVEVVRRVLAALDGGADAVVPVLAVTDTIRAADPATGELGEVVDRSRLLAMQTPQGFRRHLLVEAHARGAGGAATDDAALVEALGARVVAVAGDERAFKITVPIDLALAEMLARG